MATNYSPKIITDGLVLCLDVADKNSYPGSGTTWTDLSPEGNNGTLNNGPTFDSGVGGSIVVVLSFIPPNHTNHPIQHCTIPHHINKAINS